MSTRPRRLAVGLPPPAVRSADTLPPYTPPGGSPITAVDTTAYDGDGLVTSTADGLGNVTRYGYDQMGDQVLVTMPNGGVTTTGYDADRQPLQVTGPTGAVTDSTYDYMGRLATSTQVERDTGSGAAAYTTTYSYGVGPVADPYRGAVTSARGLRGD